jgi:hypothetical protein
LKLASSWKGYGLCGQSQWNLPPSHQERRRSLRH